MSTQPASNQNVATLNRPDALHRLRNEVFDICVIGGGATGAGCAVDAASRGWRTALIEADDFGSATSGTSTKLIHGGVRYLEQAVKNLDPQQLDLVKKGLHERKTLLKLAPHLCHPLALVTPCANLIEGVYYSIGLKMYDWLAGNRNLRPSRWLNKKDALAHFPAFAPKRLHSAVLYYDGQFDDMRLNLALAQTAAQQGAAVANHLRAERFDVDPNGQLRALWVRDTLTDERFAVRARQFVNATGTRADVLRQSAGATAERLRASKGSHVVLPPGALPVSQTAMLLPKTADGRVLFVIPWRGSWLIGTTDTDADPADQPNLTADEVEYLLKHVNHYVNVALTPADVRGGFAGLRPLLQADPKASSKSVVRDHEVEIDSVSGLISIMGGKWTTYRLMAEETIDACGQALGEERLCVTETLTLHGGVGFDATFQKRFREQAAHLPEDVVGHLLNTYGSAAPAVADLARPGHRFAERIAENHAFIWAEVKYAIEQEGACTLADVLLRRLRLGLLDWNATLAAITETATLLPDASDIATFATLLDNRRAQAGLAGRSVEV